MTSRRRPKADRSKSQASASATGRPNTAAMMTARTDQSGRPNCGTMVLATWIATHAAAAYHAAARNTCRRRSSVTRGHERLASLDSQAAQHLACPYISSMSPPAADTIAAISTAPGRGGIGIVRVSGPGCAESCDRRSWPRARTASGGAARVPRRAAAASSTSAWLSFSRHHTRTPARTCSSCTVMVVR